MSAPTAVNNTRQRKEIQDHCRRHWRTLSRGGNRIMIEDEWA